jgi:hypothetical protein
MLSNGALVAYATIARECGVSAKTGQQYFQILDHTGRAADGRASG